MLIFRRESRGLFCYDNVRRTGERELFISGTGIFIRVPISADYFIGRRSGVYSSDRKIYRERGWRYQRMLASIFPCNSIEVLHPIFF